MSSGEAEETLEVIRTLMERSTRYTNLSGHAGIAAGAVALAGSAARTWLHTPFLATWIGVLIAAFATSTLVTGVMARANGEPLWTRQARTVVIALLPAFCAALVLTLVLERIGQEALLPGVWMLLWGVGALAMSFFTERIFWTLGVTFLVAGSVTLFVGATNDAFLMGLTFGAIHLAYGIVLAVTQHARQAARRRLQREW
jgi:hypothetical protein